MPKTFVGLNRRSASDCCPDLYRPTRWRWMPPLASRQSTVCGSAVPRGQREVFGSQLEAWVSVLAQGLRGAWLAPGVLHTYGQVASLCSAHRPCPLTTLRPYTRVRRRAAMPGAACCRQLPAREKGGGTDGVPPPHHLERMLCRILKR